MPEKYKANVELNREMKLNGICQELLVSHIYMAKHIAYYLQR